MFVLGLLRASEVYEGVADDAADSFLRDLAGEKVVEEEEDIMDLL